MGRGQRGSLILSEVWRYTTDEGTAALLCPALAVLVLSARGQNRFPATPEEKIPGLVPYVTAMSKKSLFSCMLQSRIQTSLSRCPKGRISNEGRGERRNQSSRHV